MQSMSVQQLLQSHKGAGTPNVKGEVAANKQAAMEGVFGNGKAQSLKNVLGKSAGKSEAESEVLNNGAGNVDFSSLFSEVKKGEGQAPTPGKTHAVPEKNISGKIAKTTNNLDQLLNNLKGTEDQSEAIPTGKEDDSVQSIKRNFFPNQKHEVEKTESPLDFLVKGAKEKNLSQNETPVKMQGEKVELPGAMVNSKTAPAKSEFLPNKITNPALAEKAQTQEQTVKVLSGEDFVKNLQAAGPQAKVIPMNKTNSKELGNVPVNLPQIKNYSNGQNMLNDSMIRNTNDLAFKETKKLKTEPSDELRTPETKVGHDLSMIKESPIAALQIKHGAAQENVVQGETKVLDLSHIDAKNTNEIIKTISDYVEQNHVAGKSSLDLTVQHDSLGQFKIQVTRAPNQSQVDMQITTTSSEGHKFFVQHESDLMKNLQQGGVNLSDLRIVSSMKESTPFSQSESRQFSQFQHEQNGDSKQFMSFESGDFRDGEGAQRRKALWQEYQERYGA